MRYSSVLTLVRRESTSWAVVADTTANVKGVVGSGGAIRAFVGAFDVGGILVSALRRDRIPRCIQLDD